MIRISSLVMLLLCLAACSSARRSEPITGPLPITTDEVARGQKAFMTHCHKCHPEGEAGLGPAINNKPLPGGLIKTQIRMGIGAMPSFSREVLADEDLDALVVYLKTLRKK